MKVSEILDRVRDVRHCIERIEPYVESGDLESVLAEDIEEYLGAYIELLLNKEVK